MINKVIVWISDDFQDIGEGINANIKKQMIIRRSDEGEYYATICDNPPLDHVDRHYHIPKVTDKDGLFKIVQKAIAKSFTVKSTDNVTLQ